MKTYFNTGTIPDSVAADAPKGFNLCARWPAHSVKLEQSTRGGKLFRVTYGLQVDDELTYDDACEKLGAALLHSLACDGRVNNNGR